MVWLELAEFEANLVLLGYYATVARIDHLDIDGRNSLGFYTLTQYNCIIKQDWKILHLKFKNCHKVIIFNMFCLHF